MWTDRQIIDMRETLLRWYDEQGRTLPWRIRPEDRHPGIVPDPYAVWLSEIMLQQTTIPHGTPYWFKFLELYPTVNDLAAASLDDVLTHWAGLGYYARARNLHKCANLIVSNHEGQFPTTKADLLMLPGIGDYTASTIAAICFNEATNIVDGNVERVVSRIHRVETPLPKAKTEIKALAAILADPERPGDYGQAVMDLGATVCTPRSPLCDCCPWSKWCAAKAVGDYERFPKKVPKSKKPVRYAQAFVIMNDGRVWLRKRPEEGLLGGMMEVPTTEWVAKRQEFSPPFDSDWAKSLKPVKHVFTHFELCFDVYKTNWGESLQLEGEWVRKNKLFSKALPRLFRKVLDNAEL